MSLLGNINYMAELSTIACTEPDWWVIATTGLAAAPPALLNLFTPGCTDIVKMKLGLSPWHARGIKSMIKQVAAPHAMAGNKFLYKIGYFAAERGLYYLMLADVTTNFINTWQSMVFVQTQCELPDAGTAYGYMSPFVYVVGLEIGLGMGPLHLVHGMAMTGSEWHIFPGFEGEIAFDVTWDSWPTRGEPVNVDSWMEAAPSTVRQQEMNSANPAGQPKNWTGGHWSFLTLGDVLPKVYKLRCFNNGPNYAQPVAGNWSCRMRGHSTGVLPWGCKPHKTTIPFL